MAYDRDEEEYQDVLLGTMMTYDTATYEHPTLKDVLRAGALMIAVEIGLLVAVIRIGIMIMGVFNQDLRVWLILSVIASLVLSASFFLISYFILCVERNTPWRRAFAVYPVSSNTIAWSIILAVWLVGMAEFIQYFSPMIMDQQEDPFDEIVSHNVVFGIFAIFALIAPFFEECFFRGFAFPIVRQRLGFSLALAIISVWFMLIHGPQYGWHIPTLMAILVVAVVVTAQRHFTGSIIPSVITHWTYNFGIIVVAATRLALGIEEGGGKIQTGDDTEITAEAGTEEEGASGFEVREPADE